MRFLGYGRVLATMLRIALGRFLAPPSVEAALLPLTAGESLGPVLRLLFCTQRRFSGFLRSGGGVGTRAVCEVTSLCGFARAWPAGPGRAAGILVALLAGPRLQEARSLHHADDPEVPCFTGLKNSTFTQCSEVERRRTSRSGPRSLCIYRDRCPPFISLT